MNKHKILVAVGHKLGNVPHTDFNLNDLPPGVEVGNLGDNSNDATAMDSDDLVPSLQVRQQQRRSRAQSAGKI